MYACSSTSLNFPEFRETVFSHFKPDEFWDPRTPDDRTVKEVISWIENHSNTPFCISVFFNAPHYPYRYPEIFERKNPVIPMEEVDIFRQGLEGDPEVMIRLRNRSRNAISFTDAQIGKVIEKLKALNIWEKTILIVTSDHGQEFCDQGIGKGHIAHNGSFSDFQTRTFCVAHYPGVPGQRLERITSHYDWIQTLFERLGVENPSSEYSNGVSIFAPSERDEVVIASWSDAAIVDSLHIINFGYGSHNSGKMAIYNHDYQSVEMNPEITAKLKRYFMDFMNKRKQFSQ